MSPWAKTLKVTRADLAQDEESGGERGEGKNGDWRGL